jgi:hypothetical protein
MHAGPTRGRFTHAPAAGRRGGVSPSPHTTSIPRWQNARRMMHRWPDNGITHQHPVAVPTALTGSGACIAAAFAFAARWGILRR